VVAHLAPGTVEVKEGQPVRQGARLGLCGNSGRSFVPHLHFQLQGSPRIGAPTLEPAFADVLTGDEDQLQLHRWLLPVEGQALRGLTRREEGTAPFSFPVGSALGFEIDEDGGRPRRETVTSRIGLLGELFLDSTTAGATLWFENQGRQFVVHDQSGRRDSLLHLLATAAPRVPYDQPAGLRWDDVLPRRRLRPRWARWLTDLAEPFLPEGGVPVDYTATRRGARLEVRGAGRSGHHALTTLAIFDAAGPLELEVRVGDQVRRARRVEVSA
jgi:hypothetical protein